MILTRLITTTRQVRQGIVLCDGLTVSIASTLLQLTEWMHAGCSFWRKSSTSGQRLSRDLLFSGVCDRSPWQRLSAATHCCSGHVARNTRF